MNFRWHRRLLHVWPRNCSMHGECPVVCPCSSVYLKNNYLLLPCRRHGTVLRCHKEDLQILLGNGTPLGLQMSQRVRLLSYINLQWSKKHDNNLYNYRRYVIVSRWDVRKSPRRRRNIHSPVPVFMSFCTPLSGDEITGKLHQPSVISDSCSLRLFVVCFTKKTHE